MRLLGPWLLLLEYLDFSDSLPWNIEHPKVLYAWEQTCIWIPCRFTAPGIDKALESITVYHNFMYDNEAKKYSGPILYNETKSGKSFSAERVQFLGDLKSNCTLGIDPVKAQDSGVLGWRMTSQTDKWMESITLNISKTAPPPRIQLSTSDMQESKEVTLTCLLDFACFGSQIKLLWLLEGSHKSASATRTVLDTKMVSTQSELTFRPQWTDHGKNLTCGLWNDMGNGLLSQQTVRLDVKYSPKLKIKVIPEKAIVNEGDEVTMMCQISSNPEHREVYWLKDGQTVQEGTLQLEQKTLTLTLSPVTKGMSGTYCCEAYNDLGSEKSEVVLQVYYAPEPSWVQISSPVKEGSTVRLTCMSQANPAPANYTWYHNNVEMLRTTDKTFLIRKVTLEQAGAYSCLAENSLGLGRVGQKAELDVQYAPKKVTTVIQNPTPIREGGSVNLLCNHTSSNPGVTSYRWSPPGSGKELLPGVLSIEKVTWDAGPFACAACNQWCSWSPTVSLRVQYAPRGVRILPSSPHSEVPSGRPVLLQCNVSSSRPAAVHFSWKKNGSPLKEGRELHFDSISPEDAGSYHCLANNSVGQSTSEAWLLRVLYAPRRLRVSISPKDSVMEGKKVVLLCESDANPPISRYSWFDWNNQNLHHDSQMLRLDPVKVEHSGAYWCQGVNPLGTDRSPPSTLTVYYSPETISRRVALAVGLCLALLLLPFLGVKLQRSWKKIQSQQRLQENPNEQSFFVRNKKVRRAPLAEGPHSLGCYNPAMEESVSYATLRFPVGGEIDTPRTGDAETPEAQRSFLDRDNTVTYSVVQKRQAGDYENVTSALPEDDGIHYSELVHLGLGERPQRQEDVDYVTLRS